MATLPLSESHFQPPTVPADRANNQTVQYEVVEISSDEEDESDENDDGQPESSGPVIRLSPSTKRTVGLDDSDDILGGGIETYYHDLEIIRGKRQKLDELNAQVDFDHPIDATDFMNVLPDEQNRYEIIDDFPYHTLVDLPLTDAEGKDDHIAQAFNSTASPQMTRKSPKAKKPKRNRSIYVPMEVDTSQGKIRLEVPPYYDDPKLEVRMYCGPGYEDYPSVLGLVAGHQDICDEWDILQTKRKTIQKQRQAAKSEFASYINDTIESQSDNESDDDEIMNDLQKIELECLAKVREVLPDVQRKFALQKIRDHVERYVCAFDKELQIQPDPAFIVNEILEDLEYPKQVKPTELRECATDGTGVTIEWRKGDTESMTYQGDAVYLIASQFEYVPSHFIYKTVLEKKSLFATYIHIHEIEMNYHKLSSRDRPYRRHQNPRTSLEKKYSTDKELRSKDQWENLVNELQAAKQQIERDSISTAKKLETEAIEAANLEEHKENGNLIQCQCCFDEEIPINRAVSCEDKDIHWFCFSCILSLAENQVGSMKHEMSCMHQSGCKANLSPEGIGQAIPTKLIDKLAFYQQQYEITAACIEGLEQCPFCDFKAICDPIEETSVFQCQNPDCGRVSCRRCHEDSHLPKSCEEVKNDRQISARHQVEEARSEAMMRACPKCKVKIIKEIGCNKMKCGRCGCAMCYVCKADISNRRDGGYGHFNEPGTKCFLYDKGFDRHEAEADEAEKKAIKRVQAEIGDIDEKQLQIETGKPKKNEPPRRDRVGLGFFAGLHPPPMPRPNHAAFREVMRQHQARFEEAYQRILAERGLQYEQQGNDTGHAERADHLAAEQQDFQLPRPANALHEEILELHRQIHPMQNPAGTPRPRTLLDDHHRRVRELHNRHLGDRGQAHRIVQGPLPLIPPRAVPEQNRLHNPLPPEQPNNTNAMAGPSRPRLYGAAQDQANNFQQMPAFLQPGRTGLPHPFVEGPPRAEQLPNPPPLPLMNLHGGAPMANAFAPWGQDRGMMRPAPLGHNAAHNVRRDRNMFEPPIAAPHTNLGHGVPHLDLQALFGAQNNLSNHAG